MRQFASTYKPTVTALMLGISLLVPCSRSSAQTLPDYLPTNGLVGWWPFNGNANDESGNGNHGIVYGATPIADSNGNINSAFYFDGVNDFIEVPHSPLFNFSSGAGFSVCFSFQFNGSVTNLGGFNGVVGKSCPSGQNPFRGWQVGTDGVALKLETKGGQIGFPISEPFECNYLLEHSLSETAEFLFVFSAESSAVRVFVNGQILFEATCHENLTEVDNQHSLLFGLERERWFHSGGVIDDIGIWNRALTDAEVMTLYLGELPVAGCTDATACNFNPGANFNDGTCVPSGCLDAAACNFNAAAGCGGVACDFTCCPGPGCCGEGMDWDAAAQTCTIDPDFITSVEAAAAAEAAEAAVAEALDGVCGPGTVWDSTLGMCTGAGPTATCASDLNGNGAVEIQDLLILLSEFATLCPVPEPVASACGDLSAVSFDGYSYPLVAIGSQCWFKENLRSDNCRNGDPIPGGLSNAEWTSTTAGAQAVYNEDPANLELYGRLYNWYAVNDARGLCPTGWHVPSDGEWTELENELGGASIAGTALKSSSNDVPPWDGTNSSGFSALPSAHRNDETGNFVDLGGACSWWSHSPNAQRAWMRDVFNNQPHIGRASYQLSYGFSVRCLRD